MPVISTMMNTAAPITGGISCPPALAALSTPPANSSSYPWFFMSGIVTAPLVRTFATELPESIPMKPLEMTASFAGPPVTRPSSAFARSRKKSAPPEYSRSAPKRMKRNT